WGVTAQFFYVGAQIGVWSFTIRYVMQELGLNEDQAASYYLAALILFTVSRFINTWLMRFLSPGALLCLMSLIAMGCTLGVILAGGPVGVYSLVGISGCMSLMFPTIFGLSVQGLGRDTKIGGAGLIMAILGGAVLTALQGQVSDMTGSIRIAYAVPMACFLVTAWFGGVVCPRESSSTRR
ncbi:MAG: glucose/galactose MFS transporter, partial [Acidobacteriota bacterium]|nr:glucose/galactose MFS transporter [Acidobacteriota bacterium]